MLWGSCVPGFDVSYLCCQFDFLYREEHQLKTTLNTVNTLWSFATVSKVFVHNLSMNYLGLKIYTIFRCDSISRNGIYTGHSLTYSLTYSQSWIHPLGQGSRPFRQSKNVKKGVITIIAITAIMAITVSMAIAAITAITDIRAITASTGIRGNFRQYNYYCQ